MKFIRYMMMLSLLVIGFFNGFTPNDIASAKAESILVQSTTSTANSGLLDYILPIFTAKTGIEVKVVAVGTGQAIKNAANGDGDVLLVHSKADEEKFVAEGDGVKRFSLMANDFIIIGPKADPAAVKGEKDVMAALQKIANSKSVFTSRGDDSGTHKMELALWQKANISAEGDWYRSTGSGMGATLNVAIGMDGYSLTDRATWAAFANKADHEILVEGDNLLLNQYGVILVNPAKHPNVKIAEGQAFIDWLISDEGQATINSFQIGGKQVFFANYK